MAKKFLWAYNQQALKSEDGNFYFAIPDPSIYADPSTYGFSFMVLYMVTKQRRTLHISNFI
jgi:hypothetical protein